VIQTPIPGALPSSFDDEVLADLRARLASLPRQRLVGDAPRAAVLVPLCHVGGRASVLFTRRSETVGTHKGHVSFPGGMVDEGDADVEAAALRELFEEIGVPNEAVHVLGRYHDARAITGVHVTPVVGFLGDVALDELSPNPAEIDGVFALALPELVDPASRYQQDYGERGRLQVFDAGPWPVWGLTAFILEGVLRDVLDIALPDVDVRPGRPV
jgi:8-oxo-dGTP pyrophosphatase MutT (NUDIX family)